MLVAYVALLLLSLFVCLNMQFGMGWEALLDSPIGDRLRLAADAIGTALNSSDMKEWDALLTSFGTKYGATFYLFDPFGKQLAGSEVSLPLAIRSQLERAEFPSPPAIGHMLLRPAFPPALGLSSAVCNAFPGLGAPGNLHAPLPISLSAESHRFENVPIYKVPHLPPMVKFVSSSNNQLWICIVVPIFDNAHHLLAPARLLIFLDSFWRSPLLFDFRFLGLVIAAVVLFTLIFWWPFVQSITSRLAALTYATKKIADGDFDTRTNASYGDELGQLAQAINLMADRLKAFLQSQRRLVGDISHELVTPLARMDMAIELLDSAQGQERNELISDIKEEIRGMHHLVDEILALTKAGLKAKATEVTTVSVAEMVSSVLRQLRATGIAVSVDDLNVLADPLLLGRALSNVLRNSLNYAGDTATIKITTQNLNQWTSILVQDTGPGVPADSVAHLGEPFFRPEYSRNRESGGAGLGLAIAKSCIEHCGGSIEFSNRAEGGFQVEIRLRAAVAKPELNSPNILNNCQIQS